MREPSSLPLSLRLHPASGFVLSVFAGAGAWAEPAQIVAAAAPQVASVEFNDIFLNRPGGARVDVSRFSKGNVTPPGNYRVDLYVNQSREGRIDVELRPVSEGSTSVRPCFDRALLERVGVDFSKLSPEAQARLDEGIVGSACTPLAELVPDAVAVFDGGELRLDVSVPQVSMSRQTRGYVDSKYWDDGVTAAMLRYNANTYRSQVIGRQSSTQSYLGLDGGVNVGAWRLRHAGNMTDNTRAATGPRYQSQQTYLQRAFAPIKSQLTLGDAFPDGAVFDSFGFRGVQLASDDRMYPESQRGYAPTIRGTANSNALVQVRQNGNVIYSTTVAAGAFEINDLYPTGYGGDLELAVTEADGTVRITRLPYTAAVNALRPGVTRYSLTAGQYRSAGLQKAAPYLIQGTLQHGFNNTFTGYGGLVAAENYAAGSVGVAMNTGIGAFGGDISLASTRLQNLADRNGQSLRLAYSKLIAPTNTNVALAAYRYSSRGYLGLGDAVALLELEKHGVAQAAGIQRGRLQLTINQALPAGYGWLYVSGSTQDYWNREGRDTQFQAGYNNNYKQINYGISFGRQFNLNLNKWENRLMLTVSIPLGDSPRAPYSSTTVQRESSGATSVQETVSGTLGRDNAFSYGLRAGHSGGAQNNTSVGANASYASPVATVTGNASRASNYSQVGAGISGGIVAYGGGVAFTPSMGETMAVVEAEGAEGAVVSNGSGLRVDGWGHAVVSSLQPFTRNPIELDPSGLPLNVQLDSTQEQTVPTAGAVTVVRFDVESAGRAAILRAKRAGGAPLPFGAEVLDRQGHSVGTVAQAGKIIARNLGSDNGEWTVRWGAAADETCKLRYALPKAASTATTYLAADAECN